MTSEVIALFPLPLVLFPKSLYPLRIFEPRYQKLLDQCLAGREGFGIVPVIDGVLASYGCFAEVVTVTKISAEGDRDIIVKGTWRFEIGKTWIGKAGFALAAVSKSPDLIQNLSNHELLSQVDKKFRLILKYTSMELTEEFWSALEKTGLKSYKYAEKVGLTLSHQLDLLKMDDEHERLLFLKSHLDKLLGEVDGYLNLKNIIQNDGYLNP